MTDDALESLQKWLDNPEPGTSEPTIRDILNTSAGTLYQQAIVRLFQALVPKAQSQPKQVEVAKV